jgi:hypothetical protein
MDARGTDWTPAGGRAAILPLRGNESVTSEVQEGGAVPLLSIQEIERRIHNLAISADAKAILVDIARLTVEVGTTIVRAGQRILSFVIDLIREFPNTSFGLVAAFVVSSLIASVPLLGALLGPLLAPLLLALGLTAGAFVDLKERAMTSRVRVLERELVVLTASSQ